MPTERFTVFRKRKSRSSGKQPSRNSQESRLIRLLLTRSFRMRIFSRGSFYTYFEDKQDVVRYIFEDHAAQLKNYCEGELNRNGGDFFTMLDWLFEFTIAS